MAARPRGLGAADRARLTNPRAHRGQVISLPSGSMTCQSPYVVSEHVEAVFFEVVVALAQSAAVSGHGGAVGFPSEGVVGVTPRNGSVAADPDAGGEQQHDGVA